MKKCYTAKSPVLDCLWCTFHLPSGHSSRDQDTVITGRYNQIGGQFRVCTVVVQSA